MRVSHIGQNNCVPTSFKLSARPGHSTHRIVIDASRGGRESRGGGGADLGAFVSPATPDTGMRPAMEYRMDHGDDDEGSARGGASVGDAAARPTDFNDDPFDAADPFETTPDLGSSEPPPPPPPQQQPAATAASGPNPRYPRVNKVRADAAPSKVHHL